MSGADDLATVAPDAAAVVAQIAPEELQRLLGMPRARPLEGELLARAEGAKGWYAAHGRPRILARRAAIVGIESTRVRLDDGRDLDGRALAARLADGRAHAALAVAVTAGGEIDAETDRLWRSDLPDEAFFLDRVGTAVVERLMLTATLWLCRDASAAGETALPHLSPGCGAWELDAQRHLFAWLAGDDGAAALPPFDLLESGMLKPKLSLLAVVGLTHDGAAVSAIGVCRACDLVRCAFRRAPYGKAAA